MRAAKVDGTQAEIVAALRKLGWSVFLTHRVGAGFPDAVAAKAGVVKLCEIKTAKGKLNREQMRVFATLAMAGVPVVVLRTVEDAVRL